MMGWSDDQTQKLVATMTQAVPILKVRGQPPTVPGGKKVRRRA